MAVFRVEKNKGYTVMSNHHLRNKALSLKAKGLLSQMLSLPEDWDYTLKGLSLINRESIDAIRTAVWELERAGYIRREQGRDAKGKMADMVYTIYEQPVLAKPVLENPVLENPTSDNPISDNPASGNPTQLNKEIQRTNLSKPSSCGRSRKRASDQQSAESRSWMLCGRLRKPETPKRLQNTRNILQFSVSEIRNTVRSCRKPEKLTRNISAG